MVAISEDSFFTRFLKTDENNHVIGNFDATTKTYTGELNGWKVTSLVVGTLALTASVVSIFVGVSALGCFGNGYRGSLSALTIKFVAAHTGIVITLGLAGTMAIGGTVSALMVAALLEQLKSPS